MSEKQKRGWKPFGWWFKATDTPDERRLLTKLDLLIVPYAVLAYWTMFFDQANLNNAYVSGLKEDLGFYGNELVQLQTLYNLGATLGQIPFAYIFTRVPMSWVIPFLNVAWGIFTLTQYRITSYAELAAYRFLVGVFEAVYFPAVHYVLGAWYRGTEIGRRGGMFYCGLPTGILTASFIQSAASASLDGRAGLAGWRWMFIICGVLTIPIGILGYFVLPGTPDKPNRIVLNDKDLEVSKARLARDNHGIDQTFKWSNLKKAYRNKKIWGFIILDVLFWQAGLMVTSGAFLLWLKSLDRYSDSKLNALGAIPSAVGIFSVLLICFSSDLFLGPVWAITVSHTWNIVGTIIMVVWDVKEGALWFSFCTVYFAIAMSSALYGWVNTELRANAVERSITLITINIIAQSTTAWTPLLVQKTVDAPRFKIGYSFVLGCSICLILWSHVLNTVFKRDERKRLAREGLEHGAVELVNSDTEPEQIQVHQHGPEKIA
ncbi:MFS transporter (Seo1) [Exophiala dermatitidis]|uniref:MFS transporter, ACS family, allantoate permease n=2 Tax=Exophiala dermatitidis TaxID=5970 RepID=H6BU17_EXODN|nr:MFS transporter, ACS family, allantoate permease [Exophiala dermatitidis NIH/UT8656]KAJ4506666.1 MFS transporter (Seo1) [Exophiala dermatitidis]EHY55594.1 MFS transporter, ACS family, allantoate permease [Exophiala dermatitidis NIH/UT8656]KAJ4508942.1 MFS transporter (Seo1) [Exophiala dermatitidis]KAJ4510194.1 MFS transporter (Seo1) [Exophiala dermatitidis]KAJ4539201.1 MFS transporter (Seo1) [Exophiala dermatitidis]